MSPKNPTASNPTASTNTPKNAAAERLKKEALAEIGKRLNEPAATPNGAKRAKRSPKDATKRAPVAHGQTSAVKSQPGKPSASPKAAKSRPMGALDAAAKVLGESKKPMRAIEIYAEIESRGMWKTLGKTPEATIYAAMIREIAAKGNDSRFKKAERGMFTATGKGA